MGDCGESVTALVFTRFKENRWISGFEFRKTINFSISIVLYFWYNSNIQNNNHDFKCGIRNHGCFSLATVSTNCRLSLFYYPFTSHVLFSKHSLLSISVVLCFLRWLLGFKSRIKMGLTLGLEEETVIIESSVAEDVSNFARHILVGKPLIPRRQNMRSMLVGFPRIWGAGDTVCGRALENGQFQFLFPTTVALSEVLEKGPWAFNERMVTLQRWTTEFVPQMLDYMPIWVRIRGVPFQCLSRSTVVAVARSLGPVLNVDFDPETAFRSEYIRVNWNVHKPLRFQRKYQFGIGDEIVLRYKYERAKGFCIICGLLLHDSGEYVPPPPAAAVSDNNGVGKDSGMGSDLVSPQGQAGVRIRELSEEEIRQLDMASNSSAGAERMDVTRLMFNTTYSQHLEMVTIEEPVFKDILVDERSIAANYV